MPTISPYRKLSVLIPVYNEQWTLRPIVERVLSSPISLELEIVLVDDCSQDGSWQVIEDLSRRETRIKAVRHRVNGGKGTAIRTAIAHMTGDIAVVQDADLEYDPHEFPALLEPILDGRADAVFGSRYTATVRRVPNYWHTQVNRFLTFLSNVINGLLLTDMETCYKMVRADVLRQLRLKSATFTLEPELTARLAQWGARIYEVPITYSARSFAEGKKIRPIDGLKAIGEMLRCRFLDRCYTHDHRLVTLKAYDQAPRLHRSILQEINDLVGQRVLHLGAGIGTLSSQFLNREKLVLAENDAVQREKLRRRFADRENLQIVAADVGAIARSDASSREHFDTVLYTNWLQDDTTEQVFKVCQNILSPQGKLVVIEPATSAGLSALRHRLTSAGFEVVLAKGLMTLPQWLADYSRPPQSQLRWAQWWAPISRRLEDRFPGVPLFHIGVGQSPRATALRLAA